ncbi:MAG: hypothetical protein ACREOZ_01055 [Gloeomargaritales cyanobacterium]
MHLEGTALSAWQTILSSNNARSANQFTIFIKAFKKKYLKQDDHHHVKDYLRDLRKPRSRGVSEFFQRFTEIHMLIKDFLGATGIDQFGDQELKRILFKAMPLEWQRGFTLAGNKVHDEDILTIEE